MPQRVVGVTIDRTLNRIDPQQGVGDGVNHFAAEGTGVAIRFVFQRLIEDCCTEIIAIPCRLKYIDLA